MIGHDIWVGIATGLLVCEAADYAFKAYNRIEQSKLRARQGFVTVSFDLLLAALALIVLTAFTVVVAMNLWLSLPR